MSRRIATAVAAAVVGAGLVPLGLSLANAAPAGCGSWTDLAGDATKGDPEGLTNEDDLDLVKVAVTSDATAMTVAAQVKALSDLGPDNSWGDKFITAFTAGGKSLTVTAARDELLDGAPAGGGAVHTYYISDGTTKSTATGAYDVSKNTVSVTFKKADLAKLVGKSVDGLALTAWSTTASEFYSTAFVQGSGDSGSSSTWDTATAPATFTVTDPGSGCGGAAPGPVPTSATPSASATPTATPSATASATPTATTTASPTPSPTTTGTPGAFEEPAYSFPRAGCQLFTDAPGDGTPTVQGPAAFQNDGDIDVTSVSASTTGTAIKVLTTVAALGDHPAEPVDGDRFEVTFKANGKTFVFGAGRAGQVSGGASAATGATATTNGTADSKLKFTQTYDKTKNTVVFTIDRAGLEAAAGAPVPVGTALTGFLVKTYGYLGNQKLAADTAQAAAAADQQYVVGDNACFFPPAAQMEWLGDDTVTSEYGDLVEGAVALTSDAGDALEGRTVTFTLGTATVSGVTDSDGVADVFIPALVAAPGAKLVAAFAGDAENYRTSLPYDVTVSPEGTKLTLAIAKSGTKRTVTATLVDNDKPAANPVAGQKLDVLVNGKKVGTVTTDAKGKAAWAKAVAGQTVKFSLAAVTGKYAAAAAQAKLT